MSLGTWTMSAQKRYYIVEIEKPNTASVQIEQVKQAILENFKTVFGTYELNSLKLDIFEHSNNRYVICVPKDMSVSIRAALLLPTVEGIIKSFNVLSDSSFLQPLIHDSRLFFQPL